MAKLQFPLIINGHVCLQAVQQRQSACMKFIKYLLHVQPSERIESEINPRERENIIIHTCAAAAAFGDLLPRSPRFCAEGLL